MNNAVTRLRVGRTVRIVSMRSALVLLPVLAVLTACGGLGEPRAYEDIDIEAWKADLLATSGTTPDMEMMYDLAADQCDTDVDTLALGFTLVGADPPATRVNFEYVCPSELDKVDQALEQVQNSNDRVDDACTTEESQRTEAQQRMAEVMGC